MSIERTRGGFNGLKESDYTSETVPKPQQEPAPQTDSRRFPWSKTALYTTEAIPTIALLGGLVTNNPLIWVSSVAVLAVEGAGIYLYNIAKFIKSPAPKA